MNFRQDNKVNSEAYTQPGKHPSTGMALDLTVSRVTSKIT